jgi:hypothetical protein
VVVARFGPGVVRAGSLVARCAPRTGRRVVFAAQIDQIRENSCPGDDGGTQWQDMKKSDQIHFNPAVSALKMSQHSIP